MPYKKRIPKQRREGPSPLQIDQLLHGHDFFGLGFRNNEEMQAAWYGLREEQLERWIAERPGTRPWAWWRFEAREPRRVVSGKGRVGTGHFGLPALASPEELLTATYESETAYIDRLRLGDDASRGSPDQPATIPGYCPIRTAGDFVFSRVLSDRVLKFFELHLRHVKGSDVAGTPLTLPPWLAAIVGPLFGWIDLDTGLRRYRNMYLEVPKKNSKSTTVAGLALYLLTADGEAGAEVFSAGGDIDQAGIAYDIADMNVAGNSALSGIIKRYIARKMMLVPHTNSQYRALSADVPTKHGLNASAILFDELHAQPHRLLWDVLNGAVASRMQPLTIAITTAGDDRHSICWEQHRLAEQVRDGLANPRFMPVIYAAGEHDPWDEEATWRKANPNYGASVKAEFFELEVAKCKTIPAGEPTFRRLHLDQWVQTETRWIAMAAWNAMAEPRFDESDGEGKDCCLGLDLSAVSDITAATVAWRHGAGVRAIFRFWAPREKAEQRSRNDGVPYLEWAEQGLLKLTNLPSVDYDVVLADIKELGKRFNFMPPSKKDEARVAVDPWQGEWLMQKLEADGYKVKRMGQTHGAIGPASKWFEALVLNGQLWHNGHPVMAWMVDNTCADSDADGNLKPSKKKSNEKIDGVISTIEALDRLMVLEEPCSEFVVHWA